MVDGGPSSPRDSLSLDEVEKQSLVERMKISGQTKGEKAYILFKCTGPWLVSAVLALANLMLLSAFLKQQRPREIGSAKSWMPPEGKPNQYLLSTSISNEKTFHSRDDVAVYAQDSVRN